MGLGGKIALGCGGVLILVVLLTGLGLMGSYNGLNSLGQAVEARGDLWEIPTQDPKSLLPRLLECGLGGFQGFQYEDGMDYERICRMKDRNGESLFIIGGVSVTRTLPFGTPDDVRKQMKWLVDNGPRVGLFLGPSSSITPGTPHANLNAFMEGLQYYRQHGRG